MNDRVAGFSKATAEAFRSGSVTPTLMASLTILGRTGHASILHLGTRNAPPTRFFPPRISGYLASELAQASDHAMNITYGGDKLII
jgi:hypothetical protein